MKTAHIALALLLAAPGLSACSLGSPYRVETRDPAPVTTAQQSYEQLLWERKRAERSKGGD